MAFEPTLIYYYIKDLSRLIQCNCERQDIIRGGVVDVYCSTTTGGEEKLVLDFFRAKNREKRLKKFLEDS